MKARLREVLKKKSHPQSGDGSATRFRRRSKARMQLGRRTFWQVFVGYAPMMSFDFLHVKHGMGC